VHVAFLGAEVHGGTLLGCAAPINTSNDFVFGVTQTSRAVNVGVGAEFLNEVYLNRQAFAGFAQREVFGANTEADLVQFGLGEDISLDGIHRAPKLHATIHHGNFQNVHRGDPMKPATKRLSGWSYMRRGVSTCCRMPSLSTATRSPIVMASVWSCVT